MSTLQMSVSDWIKVRDNPIQRDTERHAAKAKHLLTPLPIHAITFAAKLPNGELFARTTRPGWSSWGNQVGKFGEVA